MCLLARSAFGSESYAPSRISDGGTRTRTPRRSSTARCGTISSLTRSRPSTSRSRPAGRPAQPDHRARPEHPADHGRVLQHGLLLVRQSVQPGRDQPLDRARHVHVGDRGRDLPPRRRSVARRTPSSISFGRSPPVQGVALAPFDDQLAGAPPRSARAGGRRSSPRSRPATADRGDRRRVALAAAPRRTDARTARAGPAPPSGSAPAPSRATYSTKSSSPSSAQWSPRTQDERVPRRHPLEEPPPGVEQLLAAVRPPVSPTPRSAPICGDELGVAEQLLDARPRPSSSTTSAASSSRTSHCALIASASAEYVVFPYARQRPRRQWMNCGQPLDVPLELGRQPGLADARGADDRHERGPALGLDALNVCIRTDISSSRPISVACIPSSGRSPRCFARHAQRLPRGHRLGLPLQVERQAAPGTRSRPSSPRGRPVPTSTRPGSAAVCRRAAVFTASPVSIRSRGPPARSMSTSTSPASTPIRIASCGLPSVGEPAVQLRQHRLHLERGAHRALGVVLVRARDAEHREHRVAHELLEQPFVAGDLLGNRSNARPTTAWTTSGSSCSASVVDPTRSANSAVANFRSSRAGSGAERRHRSSGRTAPDRGSPPRSSDR